MSVERFAVKLRARRLAGSLMLHQCPCGGIVSFNGLFAGLAASAIFCTQKLGAKPENVRFFTSYSMPQVSVPPSQIRGSSFVESRTAVKYRAGNALI